MDARERPDEAGDDGSGSWRTFRLAGGPGLPALDGGDTPAELEVSCVQCGGPMNPVAVLMGPVCGRCCRENHRRATGGGGTGER